MNIADALEQRIQLRWNGKEWRLAEKQKSPRPAAKRGPRREARGRRSNRPDRSKTNKSSYKRARYKSSSSRIAPFWGFLLLMGGLAMMHSYLIGS